MTVSTQQVTLAGVCLAQKLALRTKNLSTSDESLIVLRNRQSLKATNSYKTILIPMPEKNKKQLKLGNINGLTARHSPRLDAVARRSRRLSHPSPR